MKTTHKIIFPAPLETSKKSSKVISGPMSKKREDMSHRKSSVVLGLQELTHFLFLKDRRPILSSFIKKLEDREFFQSGVNTASTRFKISILIRNTWRSMSQLYLGKV